MPNSFGNATDLGVGKYFGSQKAKNPSNVNLRVYPPP